MPQESLRTVGKASLHLTLPCSTVIVKKGSTVIGGSERGKSINVYSVSEQSTKCPITSRPSCPPFGPSRDEGRYELSNYSFFWFCRNRTSTRTMDPSRIRSSDEKPAIASICMTNHNFHTQMEALSG
ncbi:unnamed protein product [Nesidiocoris tenuis]|uniref:Uncharacterized protein n=1 Tax=Nesidiocoris tenuis TaxID=355587 RepID=A0A6H5HAH0_9HEMI|nr:unnamed protein product [Nesidiocoris tenuis]